MNRENLAPADGARFSQARSPEPGARSPSPGARFSQARSPEPGARSPAPVARRPSFPDRRGFGFWVIAVVLILLILFGVGIASYSQNQQLNRTIVEAYLGRAATDIASSAIDEVYWKLTRHMMTPMVDSDVKNDWDSLLVEVPSDVHPAETIPPRMTRRVFEPTTERPIDFTVEDVEDVEMTLVHREMDFGHGFWCGAIELETAVRLRMGRFPAGVAVTRRLRVRKRYYATQVSATQSPIVRFMPEDLSREVSRQ